MQLNTVFLDRLALDCGDIDFSALDASAPKWISYDATSSEQTLARIASAHIVISNKVMLDRALINAASMLKLICISATGTNNVDLDAARAAGIAVYNVTRYATATVAQHVFALILALATQLPAYLSAVRAGRWQHSTQFCLLDFPIYELAGKTIGIIGYGELGRAVAHIATALGMRVIIAQRPGSQEDAERCPLPELLKIADIITLHCPLTPQTEHLIGATELRAMKPSALLINTARGGLVDEHALAHALRARWIAGAGIDVLSQEPPRDGNPLLASDIPNLLVTPHIAWGSREARQRLVNEVAENIKAFLTGAMRNRVV